MKTLPDDDADPVKPVFETRINACKGTVWMNEHGGNTYFNTTFVRLFKEDDTSKWKSANSFGRDDLLPLAKVADQCHSWICREEAKMRKEVV